MFRNRGALWVSFLAAVAATPFACSSENDESARLGAKRGSLRYVPAKLWSQRDIPVCWDASADDFTDEKLVLEEVIRGARSWAAAANVRFVGWSACPTGFNQGIRIGHQVGEPVTDYIERPDSAYAEITFDLTRDSSLDQAGAYGELERCPANSLVEADCLGTLALHQFGHALAMMEERYWSDCDEPNGAGGSPCAELNDLECAAFGEPDDASIMNVCDPLPQLSAVDRRGTNLVYGAALGHQTRLADFSGDGRADLLCHQVVNTRHDIDYAAADTYGAVDWGTQTGWCTGDRSVLFKGNFNGTAAGTHDDLLCLHLATGVIAIDFAPFSNLVNGTDWSADLDWCVSDGSSLHVGDFDGDGDDDLLCLNRSNGVISLDHAAVNVVFGGVDWSQDNDWCVGPSSRLHVGRFGNSSVDSLLCHDLLTGTLELDYPDSSGEFDGTDWINSAGWCTGIGSELHVGDFDGDGLDDLLCHSGTSGRKLLDYNESGEFTGTDWERNAVWCNQSASRLFVGRINGDARDDMLCHNVVTGTKAVDYADSSGKFFGTNWSTTAGWCHAADAQLY
jgi:hypothetical protein